MSAGPPMSWQVAVVRAPGRVARLLAAEVAHQLRSTGSVVVEVDAACFVSDDLEAALRAPAPVHDLVIQVGRRVPDALRLATELGVPLLGLDHPLPSSVSGLVHRVLADQALGSEPVLEVSLDGTSMLTTAAVCIRHGSALVRRPGADKPRRVSTRGLRVAAGGSGRDLELDDIVSEEAVRATLVEIDGDGCVQLVVDGAERVTGRVVLRPHPVMLRIPPTGRVA